MPTGIGHTTSCFLQVCIIAVVSTKVIIFVKLSPKVIVHKLIQVEGSHTGEAYLTTENNEEHQSLDSLPQLGSALAEARLESSCKVR